VQTEFVFYDIGAEFFYVTWIIGAQILQKSRNHHWPINRLLQLAL